MDILKQYYMKFDEFPPKLMTVGYENEFYQKIMKEAIEENKPITTEILNTKSANLKYDVVLDDEEVDAREYARRNAK